MCFATSPRHDNELAVSDCASYMKVLTDNQCKEYNFKKKTTYASITCIYVCAPNLYIAGAFVLYLHIHFCIQMYIEKCLNLNISLRKTAAVAQWVRALAPQAEGCSNPSRKRPNL